MVDALAVSPAVDRRSPQITVAMPVFNAGRYLRPAVMSIIQQSFYNWELLVIDDGSTDGSIESLGDIDDKRLVILRDGMNKGLAARLNEAIDLARGRFLARMDQDDVAYPERFARQLAAFESAPSLDLVATRCVTIDSDDELVGVLPSALDHEEICRRPWLGFYLPHPTWMGRIEWFRRHGYALPGRYFCEDQELLLRSYNTSRFATVDEVLFAYRVRSHINWRKSARTRWTLLGLQLRHFVQSARPASAILAAVAFLLRVTSDTVRAIGEANGPDVAPPSSPVDESERRRWELVRALVRTGRGD